MITRYIIALQQAFRGLFKGFLKENIALIVVVSNTVFVALAHSGNVSKVTIVQIVINSAVYMLWVDFNFKLAFKALLAGGISHIIAVESIALYMKYFAGMGKRYDLPIYINGNLNKVIVLILFIMAIYWIFSGNKSAITEDDENLKDKDFYG
jgi:hypothetical protein